jgi:anti-sigma B factor antagonist
MILLTNNYRDALIADVQPKEANLTVSEAFKEEMLSLINTGNKYIIVNFDKVIYVDSSFLGALVASLKFAIVNKAEIVVASLNKDINDLFQLIRLDKAFKIYTTPDAAIDSRNK